MKSEKKAKALIGSYHVQQRQIIYRGRAFHFVSYAGKRPNPRSVGETEGFATWFLMSTGTRWEVVPQLVGEDPVDTDKRLLEWLERTMDEPVAAPPVAKKVKREALQKGPRFGD